MKVLITGAHFTPAKAVIEELIKKEDIDIVYIGRKTAMEGDKTPSSESLELQKLKIKYKTIITGRLRRDFDFYTLLSLLKIPIGILQSLYFILTEKPNVILSFGGYVSVPVIFAGWLFSIPIIIHEQGLVPGLANKISSIFADRICLSFKRSNSQKSVVTGNPLRKEILHPIQNLKGDYLKIFYQSRKLKLPVVFITGGNQGSHAINLALEGCLQRLIKDAFVIHQTGDSKFYDYERLKQYESERYLPVKWIGEEIGRILSEVNLVVCRSGANTLTEIAYFAVPAITIPIPNHSEQNLNAKYFEKTGLVKVIYQSKLSPQHLYENIKSMLNNLNDFEKNAKNAKELIIKDAAQRLALETVLILGKLHE